MATAPQIGAGATTVLRLDKITKRFGPLLANDAISFALGAGEVVALLGENGAGKTTLMNILFGHYLADDGVVEAFGRALPPGDPRATLAAGIGMVHQHFTLADNLSVLDNIALGTQPLFSARFDAAKARTRIAELSRSFGLEVDPQARVADLTVGEKQRVEILKALYRDARILILDEPTAVLSPLETDSLFQTLEKLVEQGLSIIFISHKLGEVMRISNRVLVLRGGRLVGERQTASATREELAELMIGGTLTGPGKHSVQQGAVALDLRAIHTRASGDKRALEGVDLQLRAGEIFGIAGVSGNGQASLAALISGMIAQDGGDLIIAGESPRGWSPREALRQGIGRIPEDRHHEGTLGDMSVAENVISERYGEQPYSRWGVIDWRAAVNFAKKLIGEYDVKCPSPAARIRLLSGGNMQKLILGRVLDGRPRIVLANQPTRGLDVGAVAYVHSRLLKACEEGAAILLISEDLDEVLALADRIGVMSKGRLSEPFRRGEKSLAEIGALMAGHGFAEGEGAHAH